jgi:NAD(P) transhydrogenase
MAATIRARVDVDFDLVAIGSGPGGQKAAIQAAKLGKRVAVIENRSVVGGICVNTGTIPSKTLREAVLYLTGANQRAFFGDSYRVKEDITFDDLRVMTRQVVEREIDVIRNQMTRNHVRLLGGGARFMDAHTLSVGDAEKAQTITADKIVIAVGTRPARPAGVSFDERTVVDSDGLLCLERIPNSMVVAGAGVIGIEYASMFAALGTRVTLVEKRESILDFCDAESVEGLRYHLRDMGLVFRLGETVVGVERHEHGTITHLASGKQIPAETVMYSAGRQGATDTLNLDAIGLVPDAFGRLQVDDDYRTTIENVFAVGDVVGFPSLAATSMEQGRHATCAAFGVETPPLGHIFPYGIYSIPELSFVGRTEHELTEAGIPYEVGVSRYRELARGQIIGDHHGMLKILVSSEDHRLLGVHALGTSATELVHVGQAVMALGGTVDYLVNAVFNYPTLAESYKVAALDAVNKLREINRLSAEA